MAVDRNDVMDLIINASSIDEMLDGLDDLDDVKLIHCKECGAIFTSDLSREDCYECGSEEVEVISGNNYNLSTDDEEAAMWIQSGVPESQLSACSFCGFDTGSITFKYCPMCRRKMTNAVQ